MSDRAIGLSIEYQPDSVQHIPASGGHGGDVSWTACIMQSEEAVNNPKSDISGPPPNRLGDFAEQHSSQYRYAMTL